MTEPDYDKICIKVGGEDVVLDPANLKFSEATLSQFLDREGSWYDFYGRHLVRAEAEFSTAKENAEVAYFRAFDAYKSEGATEKRAEAQARIENGVIEARAKQREAETNVKLLKQHLRSWDKTHENSISLGHNLRKEIDLCGNRVYGSRQSDSSAADDYEEKLEEVLKRVPAPVRVYQSDDNPHPEYFS